MNEKEPGWMKYLTEDSIEDCELLDLIKLIGFEATKKLMLKHAGIPILIPKSATSKYKHQYILDNYDGTKKSRMKLALECNITEGYVYKIIKQYKKDKLDN